MAATNDRAAQLAQDATTFFNNGETDSAKRAIHEAVALSPSNGAVKAAVTHLRHREKGGELVELCKSWLNHPSDQTGRDALQMVKSEPVADDVAADALHILLDYGEESDICDELTHQLLRFPGARSVLAKEVTVAPTPLFRRLFARGDDTMDALLDVLRDPVPWPSPEVRVTAVRDIFQLALSMAMEAGLEHPERPMSLISRLLIREAENLNGLMDADGFRVLLDCLDLREPPALRLQASIAIATLIEHSPESAHTLISQYITPRVKNPTTTTLIRAFSAATAVFPMATAPAVGLFLSDGFMPNFVGLVKRKNSTTLTTVALELLSAACVDKNCREAINSNCRSWLLGKTEMPEKPVIGILAALVLTKIDGTAAPTSPNRSPRSPSPMTRVVEILPDFVSVFRDAIVSAKESRLIPLSIEGLAYLSLKGQVKERLALDGPFLAALETQLSAMPPLGTEKSNDVGINSGTLAASPVFGVLTILANLTASSPLLTAEERRVKEIQAHASSSTPPALDPLDGEDFVAKRCIAVIDAKLVPTFSTIMRREKMPSLNVLRLISQINLSLSKVLKSRGVLAQQGALKQVLTIYDTVAQKDQNGAGTPDVVSTIQYLAAGTVARILISTNPSVVFAGTSAAVAALPPLIYLLQDVSDPSPEPSVPRTLATFESLLALTNIASLGNDATTAIVRLVFPRLDDILWSNRVLVQRAATELCCNMCTCPDGVAAFTDPSVPVTKSRFDLLVALADSEDVATRRAAGGALAILTGHQAGVKALLNRKGGVERVVALAQEDGDEGIVIRGLTCASNLCLVDDRELRTTAVERMRQADGFDGLVRKGRELQVDGVIDLVDDITEGVKKL